MGGWECTLGVSGSVGCHSVGRTQAYRALSVSHIDCMTWTLAFVLVLPVRELVYVQLVK